MQTSKEETFNVMTLALIMAFAIFIMTMLILWVVTKNLYLDYYFTLESFFNAQNTAASEALASVAFSKNLGQFLLILFVVVVDNLGRIFIVSFIIAAVIDFLNYANVEAIINDLRAGALRNHVILCGYNEIADKLAAKFKEQNIRFIVVEPKVGKGIELNEKKILNVEGDFTKAETLKTAGIEKARAILFISYSDIDNVVGSLVAKKLNPKIKILSRISEESVRKKVYGIGTYMAVIPEHLAGIEMGEYMARLYGA